MLRFGRRRGPPAAGAQHPCQCSRGPLVPMHCFVQPSCTYFTCIVDPLVLPGVHMGVSVLQPAAAARSRLWSVWASCCLCSCCQLQDGAALSSLCSVCFRSGSCSHCCSPVWAWLLKLQRHAVLHCTSVWRFWCPASTPMHCTYACWMYEHRCWLSSAL